MTNKIRHLDLSRCTKIEDLNPLIFLDLEELNLMGCSNLVDLEPLTYQMNLQKLNLSACRKAINHLHLLTKFPSLRELDISFLSMWDGKFLFSTLPFLQSLEVLKLIECPGLTTLSPLVNFTKLQNLQLSINEDLTDVHAVSRCTELKVLDIRICPRLPEHAIEHIKNSLPDCKIVRK